MLAEWPEMSAVMQETTYLVVPSIVDQVKIHVLPRKLLAQNLGVAARVTGHVGGLLGIGQRDDRDLRVGLENRLEALESRVDGAAEW